MRKKIAIIGTVGLPAKYGGFETLTDHLTQQLADKFEFTVYCSSKFYSRKLKTYNSSRLKYMAFNANGVQSIFYDIASIFSALKYANTLLILGVSGCVVLPFIKLISNRTIIVNIDGLEWKRLKWSWFAKHFLKFSEKMAVKYADKVISDNKAIQDYVKEVYEVNSELITYGADHSTKQKLTEQILQQHPFLKNNYAFKVCRIEPENNLGCILEAFAKTPSLNIVIVGNWNNGYYGKHLRLQYKKYQNIFMLDPVYDQNTLDQMRSNSMIYIHGHSAGGTNPSLVEAMHLGLPVLAYRIDYNIETTANKALYFDNTASLMTTLGELSNAKIISVAKAMEQIAKERYTWKRISKEYDALFA